MHAKQIWKVFKQSLPEFNNQNVLKKSAALAYYTVFSLAPMLIVIIAIAETFYKRDAIQGSIYGQISGFVGPTAALQIQDLIKNAAVSGKTTVASIISIITLVLTATGVFTEIQDSINTIWHLKAKPKKGFLKIILNRLLSFSLIVGLGFILMVSLVINALIEAFGEVLKRIFPDITVYIIYGINLVLTLGIITVLFAIIFKVLPDAVIRWRDVWMGAFITGLLFIIGKFAIALYLGQSNVTSSYGAAGSIIVILLWVYYSAIILYFGAIFTRIYAQANGCNIRPNDYAVFIQQVEMENRKPLQEQSDTKAVVKEIKKDN